MPMVSYQEYTAIAFSIAQDKGAEFDSINDGGQFVSELAAYWNENKEELKPLTEQQTIDRLDSVVEA